MLSDVRIRLRKFASAYGLSVSDFRKHYRPAYDAVASGASDDDVYDVLSAYKLADAERNFCVRCLTCPVPADLCCNCYRFFTDYKQPVTHAGIRCLIHLRIRAAADFASVSCADLQRKYCAVYNALRNGAFLYSVMRSITAYSDLYN